MKGVSRKGLDGFMASVAFPDHESVTSSTRGLKINIFLPSSGTSSIHAPIVFQFQDLLEAAGKINLIGVIVSIKITS
jgi:hypothetical protein